MSDETIKSEAPGNLISICNLTKSFGETKVLSDVSFEVMPGEIHGLVGQNGCGKSTLIKCLSGYHDQELSWELKVRGKTFTRGLHPGEIAGYGISFVHQDLGMLPDLTVLENLLMMELAVSNSPYISWSKAHRRSKEIFSKFGLDLNPAAILGSLRPVEQAQVAIIRAVMQLRESRHAQGEAGVLVLDEATTFLDQMGREGVHNLLRAVTSTGDSVIFVSHDIGEVLSLTDRVTVLRDGKVVNSVQTSSLDHADLVSLIVGEKDSESKANGVKVSPKPVANGYSGAREEINGSTSQVQNKAQGRLKIVGLMGDQVYDVSTEVSGGQVLGITGIVGSGWEFILEHLFGAKKASGGSLEVGEVIVPLQSMSPVKARKLSMAFVPSDRLVEGVVAELTVQDNLMQPILGQVFKSGFLRLRELTSRCSGILDRYGIVPLSPKLPMSALSGGNQQKAVIVKWLETGPGYLLLNDPTQGVDVGARRRIYELVRFAADKGAVVLFASSDWEEVAGVSDSVLVMADGRVAAQLDAAEISIDAIANAAYKGTRRSADLSKASSMWGLE